MMREKPSDTEDKLSWCRWGEEQEHAFIARQRHFFEGRAPFDINPEKADNRYAIDLVTTAEAHPFFKAPAGRLADLKCQQTPFFLAERLYGVDPQWGISVNDKDITRYLEEKPVVVFWIDWQKTSGYEVEVRPMEGVFVWEYQYLDIAAAAVDEHRYRRRTDDSQGNGRSSYVIDVRASCSFGAVEWKDGGE